MSVSAEAYPYSLSRGAASSQQPLSSMHEFWSSTHTIRYEDDFIDIFNTLNMASVLRGEIVLHDLPERPLSLHSELPLLTSCLLRSTTSGPAKSVHFEPSSLVVPGDDAIDSEDEYELDDDASSLMSATHSPQIEYIQTHPQPEASIEDDTIPGGDQSPSVDTELSFSPDSAVDHQLDWHSVAI